MDLFCRSGAPAELMGRHRGDEYEGVWTTGARRPIPVVDPMQREAARATFRSRLFHFVGGADHLEESGDWLRLSQEGFGAYLGPPTRSF